MSALSHCRETSACKAKTPGHHCRPCHFAKQASDPEFQARRLAGIRARTQDPKYREKMSLAQKRRLPERMADPAFVEKLRQIGLTVGVANLSKAQTGEQRNRAAASIRAHHLAWCPREYWEMNAELKSKGVRLTERKAMIRVEIERNSPEAAARRAIAEFDQQQRARHERQIAQAY